MTVQLAGKTKADTDAINMVAARNSITSADSYWKSASNGRLRMSTVREYRHISSARITDSYQTIMATVTRELNWQYRSYEALVIFVPHKDLNYNGSWGILGGGFTDSATSGRVIMPYPSGWTNNVVTHEFGHVLGLHHANSLFCNNARQDVSRTGSSWADPSCSSYEYGDTSDLMGFAQPSSPVINSFLWAYGGFGRGDEIRNIGTVSGTQQYRLTPWAGTAANRALRFTDPGNGETYYVEYRAPIGFDAATALGGNRGIKITKQDIRGWSGNASAVLTPNSLKAGYGNDSLTWQQGQTFTTSTGTRVRVDSLGDSATITVMAPSRPSMGYFDSLGSSRNSDTAYLQVQGWAIDPNRPSASTEAHAYVTAPNGVRTGHVIPAGNSRPDVNAAMSVSGNHGYDGIIPVTRSGTYSVCVYAIGGSENTSLGCKSIQVTEAEPPVGSFDSVEVVQAGDTVSLRVAGWAVDSTRTSVSTEAHVYVTAPDGTRTGYPLQADKSRTDVNAALKILGTHGFAQDLRITQPGTYQACAFAIGQHFNTALGCKSVKAGGVAPPIGSLDSVTVDKTSGTPSLTVHGWAMERENPMASIPVHIYVTGPDGKKTGTAWQADMPRDDVNSALGVPGDHGYSARVPAPLAGNYTVCAFGIGVSPFASVNPRLGCTVVNTGIREAPKGFLDSAKVELTASGASISATGWTLDRDAVPASIPVHTYITYPDGTRQGFAFSTGILRSDVNEALGVTGRHGYTTRTPITQRGTYEVCTYGIGISPYSPGNSLLGCTNVRY
ncbi:zinc metalloprotease [Arthrobacter sp. TMN-37]